MMLNCCRVLSSSLRNQIAAPALRSFSQKPNLLIPKVRNAPPRRNLRDVVRKNHNEPPREGETKSTTRSGPTLKERMMAPPSENAYGIGKGAAAGAAAIGLGALCFYGLGLGKESSIYNNSMMWPDYVRERVHSVYGYFGGACALTAASAALVFRSPRMMDLVTRQGWLAVAGTFALMIGSGAVTQSITYQPGIGPKQLAWVAHCAIMGAIIAPICMLGGPIMARAALYTGGLVGGLSAIATCAPNDKFLYMGGPLALGLGLVFAASLANMWLPPTTAIGAGLASLSLYGGLILFSGFLLFDTQRIILLAEKYPQSQYTAKPFDPINASLSIYMDTLNIFMRIAILLAGGGGNQKRR